MVLASRTMRLTGLNTFVKALVLKGWYKLCGHKTTLLIKRYYIVMQSRKCNGMSALLCSKQGRQYNAISSYWIRQARHTHSTKEMRTIDYGK